MQSALPFCRACSHHLKYIPYPHWSHGHSSSLKSYHAFPAMTQMADDQRQWRFHEICDYKEMHDTIGKEHYSLVLSHYPIFSWRNMGRGRILLYGHTHESEEDRFYQKCLSEMRANDCRHVYEAEELRAYNVGCMRDYMNYTPRTLEEILNSRRKV